MASNFKISDLTALGRDPAASDVLIVNDASGIQQYTRSITFESLKDSIGGGFDPIEISFTLDQANSNQAHADYWEPHLNAADNTLDAVDVGYPGDWATYTGGGLNKILGVAVSNVVPVTMPPGATAATVFFYGARSLAVNRNNPPAPTPTYRNAHTAHRLEVTGGDIGYAGLGFGLGIGSNLTLPSISPEIIAHRYERDTYCKFDTVTFDEGATLSFNTRHDVARGGRMEIGFTIGRIVILPMAASSVIRAQQSLKLANNTLEAHQLSMTDQEYSNLLDDIFGKVTVKEEVYFDGRVARDRIINLVTALNARKSAPVAGTSEAEYDAMIAKFFTLMERQDTGVDTSAQFRSELDALAVEASDVKYGIALNLKYESNAGITRNQLF